MLIIKAIKDQVWLRYEENDIEYLIINPSTNYLALKDYDGEVC